MGADKPAIIYSYKYVIITSLIIYYLFKNFVMQKDIENKKKRSFGIKIYKLERGLWFFTNHKNMYEWYSIVKPQLIDINLHINNISVLNN